MTVEERTALHYHIRQGKTRPMDDLQSTRQMAMLTDKLSRHHFEQYEISNFARDGQYARHNTSYWNGKPYLGIGPSAHSFNGTSRSWNIANNARYLRGISENSPTCETEVLRIEDQINEYIMTRLRTMWGVDISALSEHFGAPYAAYVQRQAQPFLQSGDLSLQQDTFRLTEKGKYIADRIASDMFILAQE